MLVRALPLPASMAMAVLGWKQNQDHNSCFSFFLKAQTKAKQIQTLFYRIRVRGSLIKDEEATTKLEKVTRVLEIFRNQHFLPDKYNIKWYGN